MKRILAASILTALAAVATAQSAPANHSSDFYIGPVGCRPGTSSNINLSYTMWDYGSNTRVHYDLDGGINTRWPTSGWKYQPAYVDISAGGVKTRYKNWNDGYATAKGQGNVSVQGFWYQYKKVGGSWVYQGRVSCTKTAVH